MGKLQKKKTKKILNKNKSFNTTRKTEVKEDKIPKIEEYDEKFVYHHNLTPPYSILLDTNFINDCIRKKKDMHEELLTTLNSSFKLYVTECVIAELEKLGRPYRVALAQVRSEKMEKLKCDHKGTYADDCIINRVVEHRCYIVATSDECLRQRIMDVPGVPIVSYRGRRCHLERLLPACL